MLTCGHGSASADQASAFVLTYLGIFMYSRDAAHIDQRTHLDFWIESITNPQPLCRRLQTFGKAFERAALHDHAAGSGAALTCCTEGSPGDAFGGQVEIPIVQHDHRVLAAQFQRTAAQIASTNLRHVPPDLS